ncbi:Disks large-associated protein 4 [Heterocephalus glaber]|uniref:Disks large-associated protein 4 n=1 Tax=Heterocephalus glaber TaxID=10181 RepID=G5B2R1_HETGA|nr:Disks large-associated protein 4 [Heterocephalus glaber]
MLTSSESHSETIPKRKLSTIGIQVDCIQPVPKEEPSPATKFQSIRVQHRCSPKIAHIKCNLSYGDNSDPALEASSLPPPVSSLPPLDPWLESTSSSPAEPAQPGACHRDGYWSLKLLQAETECLEGWCCQMDKETKENNLSEEVLGKVLSAVGSAQLLMSQKFQQFRGLCEQNLNPDANPRPTAQDLAQFWDLLQLSIDISMKSDEPYHLKGNSWQLVETPEKRKEEKKPSLPVPKKPAKSKPPVNRVTRPQMQGTSSIRRPTRDSCQPSRQLLCGRTLDTESVYSIKIYVPEAQIRLRPRRRKEIILNH